MTYGTDKALAAHIHELGNVPAQPDEYRGWSVRSGRWPEPAWMATGQNYDAWTEGEGEWCDNGEKADAPTWDALLAEIDAWITEHCEVCDGHGSVLHAIDDGGPCPECGVPS